MLIYHTIAAALEGMRRHLDAANTLIMENGALPSQAVRRQIDEHLDEYHRAGNAFARLSARGAREHSLKAPLSSVPDPSGREPRKPPLGRPIE